MRKMKRLMPFLVSALTLAGALPLRSLAFEVDCGEVLFDCIRVSTSSYNSQLDEKYTKGLKINEVLRSGFDVYIPDGCVSGNNNFAFVILKDGLFSMNSEITSIRLPSELMDIQKRVFYGCTSLKSIAVPAKVENIGEQAFFGCTSLETVDMGESSENLKVIPEGCFFSCTSLKKVNLPQGIETIESEAFYGCPELDMMEIPESVTYIGYDAIGKKYDVRSKESVNVENFLIVGKTGSAAQTYAENNDLDFMDKSFELMGDVDSDGMITAADASEVLAEYVRLSTGHSSGLKPRQRVLGDYDGDGFMTAMDASDILSEYVRLSTQKAEE